MNALTQSSGSKIPQALSGKRRNNIQLSKKIVVVLVLFAVPYSRGEAIGSSAFSFQGRLTEGELSTTGLFDLRFELFDAENGSSSLGLITETEVPVSSGLFTVILDFGSGVFDDGSTRWLEIAVRPNGGSGLTLLEPRIRLTPVPSALYAQHSNDSYPVGTVIDWWRADSGTPIPEGYQICDGAQVSDPGSPMHGQMLPDLRGKFIMGSTDGATIGQSGGSATHSHSFNIDHDHANRASTSAGGHAHNVNVPAFSASSFTDYAGRHNHAWVWLQNGNDFYSWDQGGSLSLMIAWGNGIGKEGSGLLPICDNLGGTRKWYTENGGGHSHSYSLSHDHPSFASGSVPAHTHSVDLPGLGTLNRTSTSGSHLPPYFGLIKIMRVK